MGVDELHHAVLGPLAKDGDDHDLDGCDRRRQDQPIIVAMDTYDRPKQSF